jgi:NADH-quinone oxidoreductase subunit C
MNSAVSLTPCNLRAGRLISLTMNGQAQQGGTGESSCSGVSGMSEEFFAAARGLPGVKAAVQAYGCSELSVERPAILSVMRALKSDPRFLCTLFLDVTVVDWFDTRPTERFEVVYHVFSVAKNQRVRVKVGVPESDPKVDSVVSVWAGANFLEREAWDMYGVTFSGHPDLRRIMMYDEFQGHPLRKDYPVQGKQPRIPLRAAEVRNTALDLKRPELVQISRRKVG